jgi:hypothetical protein
MDERERLERFIHKTADSQPEWLSLNWAAKIEGELNQLSRRLIELEAKSRHDEAAHYASRAHARFSIRNSIPPVIMKHRGKSAAMLATVVVTLANVLVDYLTRGGW